MKIALFADSYLPDINGVVSSVVLLRKKLIEHGHDVWVITNHKGFMKIERDDKEQIIRLPGIELKQLYGYKATQPLHLLYLDEIKALNFDIIHNQQEFGVGMYASIVSKTLKIPMVRTYHTAYEEYTSYFMPIYNKTFDELAKKAISSLSYVIGEDCLRLIAPSKKTKDMLIGYGITTPIEVIPTGLETEQFRSSNFTAEQLKDLRHELGIQDDERMFIYVGRVATEKSIDIVIKGFGKAVEKHPDSKLVIVGDGPSFNELKELVSNMKLEDKIIFTGRKPHDDVPLYYNAADCFMSASITETQGMTYIEALASGLPIICRYDEVLDDVLLDGENGYFFKDEDELSEKIDQFLSLNESDLKKMKDKALEVADLYDPDLFAYKVADLYERVINEYDSKFVIKKMTLKNDNVILQLENEDRNEKVTVSADTYLELGLRKGDRLTKPIYDRIHNEEAETLAYQACLKKLSNRDYSERQMRDYLYVNFELSNKQLEDIINRLKDKKYLDDEKYVFNKINSYEAAFYSRRMMIRKLKEAGIEENIINKYLHEDSNSELVKAKKMANKHNQTIKGKSLNARKNSILQKLASEGFSYDIARQAIDFIDFSDAAMEESDILKAEANKVINKYKRKYTGRDLRNHVFNSLVNKGFEYEKIYALIDEMEWDNE